MKPRGGGGQFRQTERTHCDSLVNFELPLMMKKRVKRIHLSLSFFFYRRLRGDVRAADSCSSHVAARCRWKTSRHQVHRGTVILVFSSKGCLGFHRPLVTWDDRRMLFPSQSFTSSNFGRVDGEDSAKEERDVMKYHVSVIGHFKCLEQPVSFSFF